MNSSEVKQVLREKGVEYLYHANSVLTSISYLENGGLMSREYVEECDYPQTPQVTDDTDKEFEIYNDIFLDSVDVHALSKNVNFYGPVLLVYSIDVLDEVSDYDICVTRTNAIYWSEKILLPAKDIIIISMNSGVVSQREISVKASQSEI